jgi:hypothetical protein
MAIKFTLDFTPARIEFTGGTIEEIVSVLQAEGTALNELRGMFRDSPTVVEAAPAATLAPTAPAAGAEPEAPKPARRGRPKNQPDPATAQAPTPIPVPSAPPLASAPPAAPAAPTAPVAPVAPAPAIDHTPGVTGAPAFLERKAPSFVLAGKVVEELKKRAAESPDGGKYLADWIADTFKLIGKGASFDEAVAVVQFVDDAKIAPVAAALQIS